MNPVPAFPSVADAMAVVQAGLRFVAAADATQMSAQAQAECLQMMERANAIVTAARASVLSAFTSGQGYSADADYSPRAWLIHKTRVTKVVAVAHTAWAKRMATHPRVMEALAAEDLSESYGRDLPVDRQAARGLPSGRRRDLPLCRAGRAVGSGRRRGHPQPFPAIP
jgi:hypothetical protein